MEKYMKSILITGASRGVERSLALLSARSGYDKIILTCHKQLEELEKTKNEIEMDGGPECLISCGDISSIEYVESLRELSGPVDVLINNAAISLTGLLISVLAGTPVGSTIVAVDLAAFMLFTAVGIFIK